jgi:hypothetical protein
MASIDLATALLVILRNNIVFSDSHDTLSVSLEQAKVLGWLWEITPKYEALPLS